MINHVKKIWGSEDWLVNNEKYCAKYLNLQHGFECSIHYHAYKDETFYVLEGQVELFSVQLLPYARIYPLSKEEIDDWYQKILNEKEKHLENLVSQIIKSGEQYRLKPFTAHKFRAITPTAKILEVSTTHYDDDSYRLTESQQMDY